MDSIIVLLFYSHFHIANPSKTVCVRNNHVEHTESQRVLSIVIQIAGIMFLPETLRMASPPVAKIKLCGFETINPSPRLSPQTDPEAVQNVFISVKREITL